MSSDSSSSHSRFQIDRDSQHLPLLHREIDRVGHGKGGLSDCDRVKSSIECNFLRSILQDPSNTSRPVDWKGDSNLVNGNGVKTESIGESKTDLGCPKCD